MKKVALFLFPVYSELCDKYFRVSQGKTRKYQSSIISMRILIIRETKLLKNKKHQTRVSLFLLDTEKINTMHLLSCGSTQIVTKVSNSLTWCKALADMFSFFFLNQK